MKLKHFTLIGTSSRSSRVSKKLIPWFAVYDFEPYSAEEFLTVFELMAVQNRLGFQQPGDSYPIYARCNRSLETASVLLKRIRGCFPYESEKLLTEEDVNNALEWLG